MGMLSNRQSAGNTGANVGAKIPRDRFILGSSECYFEAAQYLTGKLNPAKVRDLFVNPVTKVMETEGKSLKVMFTTPSGEIKFTGFVTHGDASVELDSEDAPIILQHATDEEIVCAVNADELVDMF